MTKPVALIPVEQLEQIILSVRGQRVILDADLAALYGVTTTRLNEQVRRNSDRFPDEFAFRLTQQEFAILMSQNARSKPRRGGRRKLPLVFTEYGTVMAANVLSSKVAVATSIQVVRAFVRLRELLASHKDLSRRLDELERKYDVQFQGVFRAIRELMQPPDPALRRGKIGFGREHEM
jgi:hypothetical protein